MMSPQYAIVEGDYSRFHDVTFNIDRATPHSYEEECGDFLYSQEDGAKLIDFTLDTSLVENKQWDKIAFITFLI